MMIYYHLVTQHVIAMFNIVAAIYYYDYSYQDPEGQSMLRVTTVTRRWMDSAVAAEVSYFTLS